MLLKEYIGILIAVSFICLVLVYYSSLVSLCYSRLDCMHGYRACYV
jgi:hypothetical protein